MNGRAFSADISVLVPSKFLRASVYLLKCQSAECCFVSLESKHKLLVKTVIHAYTLPFLFLILNYVEEHFAARHASIDGVPHEINTQLCS